MDKKTIGIGIIAAAALAVAVEDKIEGVKEATPATQAIGDVSATAIAQVGEAAKTKSCEKGWAQVDNDKEPRLGWLCNGAWMPRDQQAWLDEQGGHDAVRIEFTARECEKGICWDGAVTTGTEPAKVETGAREAVIK
jgi:hypothetical protein